MQADRIYPCNAQRIYSCNTQRIYSCNASRLSIHGYKGNSGNHVRLYSGKAATLFTSWIFMNTTHSGTTQYHTEFTQGISTNIRKAIQSIAQVLLKTPAILSKIKEYTLRGFSSVCGRVLCRGVCDGGSA